MKRPFSGANRERAVERKDRTGRGSDWWKERSQKAGNVDAGMGHLKECIVAGERKAKASERSH